MTKEIGKGMGAFFAQQTGEPQPAPEQGRTTKRFRTTVRLSVEDADRLELLRMHLRHSQGRGLTYSDVIAMALKRLAETEPIPTLFPAHHET